MKRAAAIPLIVCAAALIYVGVVAHAMAVQAARDEARAADVIVVFGAAEYYGHPSPVFRGRLDHSLELFRRHLAPLIITTGGPGGEPHYTEAGVGRQYLLSRGLRADDVVADEEGYSTRDSVQQVSRMMRARGLRSAVVVSDGYHIFRIKKLFQTQGLVVYGSPRPAPAGDDLGRDWMIIRQVISYTLWKLGFSV